MKRNPALQIAHTILGHLGERLVRTLVQRGAHAFADQTFYLNWRKFADGFIREQLTRSYGSHVLDQHDNCWKWNVVSEHANLSHNSGFCSLSMIRIQNAIATDAIISLPLLDTEYIAAVGNGCYSTNGRCRVSKNKELHAQLLVSGEDLIGSQRIFGSTLVEIAYTAEGQIDLAKWKKLSGFMCMTAGLMLGEAGGVAINFQGQKISTKARNDSLIIGNSELVHKIYNQQKYDKSVAATSLTTYENNS